MKRLYIGLLFLLLVVPSQLLAHGGVSNQAGNVVVFLNQQPLSPLVGEEVHMTFSVKNKELQTIPKVNVVLKLIQTGNDPSQDQIIFTENKSADVNGNFDFTYKFTEEDYYDVEVALQDPVTNELVVIGFLVQPRSPAQSFFDQYLYWIIGFIIVDGLIVAYAVAKSKKPVQY